MVIQLPEALENHTGRRVYFAVGLTLLIAQCLGRVVTQIGDTTPFYLEESAWRIFFLAMFTFEGRRGGRWAWVCLRLQLAWMMLAPDSHPDSTPASPDAFRYLLFLPAFLVLNFDRRIELFFAQSAQLGRLARERGTELYPDLPQQVPFYLRSMSLSDQTLILPMPEAVRAVAEAAGEGLLLRSWNGVSIEPPHFLCADEPGPPGGVVEQEGTVRERMRTAMLRMDDAAMQWMKDAPMHRLPGYALHFEHDCPTL